MKTSLRLNKVEEAVVRSLCYASVFEFAMNRDEIWRFLMSRDSYDFETVYEAINRLKEPPIIIERDELVVLRGDERLISLGKARREVSRLKLSESERDIVRLSRIPWVLGIFVTGALAMSNSQDNDDIDLMIVTRQGKLWMTRLLITLWLGIIGKRRARKSNNVKNRFCVNLWLDESSLLVPKQKQNAYTAHEVVQVLPVVDKENIYLKFMKANAWSKQYLANTLIDEGVGEIVSSKRVSMWEKMVYLIQRLYMQRHMTRETVGESMAFFHPRDTKSLVLSNFEKKLAVFDLQTDTM